MNVLLHLITYGSLLVFILAVAARFVRIQSYPLHVRWEIYPVPHEGARSRHGGSRLEEVDWWEKPQKKSLVYEIVFMLQEMILLKALYEHNRKMWWRSFPFHFGLYVVAAFGGLMVFGALLQLGGYAFGGAEGTAPGAVLLRSLTGLVGVVGIGLTIVGAIGLLLMRLTDEDLKPYTTFSHIFNLLFIVVAFGLMLAAIVFTNPHLFHFRSYIASLITFDLSASAGTPLHAAAILTVSLLLAYIPLTHMSHFFVKWFTWHKIRWDDEPNVKGGRFEVMIEKALQQPVSWSADHIHADGKKNWGDIATEEVEK